MIAGHRHCRACGVLRHPAHGRRVLAASLADQTDDWHKIARHITDQQQRHRAATESPGLKPAREEGADGDVSEDHGDEEIPRINKGVSGDGQNHRGPYKDRRQVHHSARAIEPTFSRQRDCEQRGHYEGGDIGRDAAFRPSRHERQRRQQRVEQRRLGAAADRHSQNVCEEQ